MEKTPTFQTCPHCNGTGIDKNIMHSTTAFPTCGVCQGQKIISTVTGMPPILLVPVAPPHEDKLTEKDFKEWIGGYQHTDKLDTSNPPRQTAHEDKGAEEYFDGINDLRLIKWEGLSDERKRARAIKCMQEHASNERNRAIQECIDVVDVFTPASPEHMRLYRKIVSELSKLKT